MAGWSVLDEGGWEKNKGRRICDNSVLEALHDWGRQTYGLGPGAEREREREREKEEERKMLTVTK